MHPANIINSIWNTIHGMESDVGADTQEFSEHYTLTSIQEIRPMQRTANMDTHGTDKLTMTIVGCSILALCSSHKVVMWLVSKWLTAI